MKNILKNYSIIDLVDRWDFWIWSGFAQNPIYFIDFSF
jgi:hypothetical protein